MNRIIIRTALSAIIAAALAAAPADSFAQVSRSGNGSSGTNTTQVNRSTTNTSKSNSSQVNRSNSSSSKSSNSQVNRSTTNSSKSSNSQVNRTNRNSSGSSSTVSRSTTNTSKSSGSQVNRTNSSNSSNSQVNRTTTNSSKSSNSQVNRTNRKSSGTSSTVSRSTTNRSGSGSTSGSSSSVSRRSTSSSSSSSTDGSGSTGRVVRSVRDKDSGSSSSTARSATSSGSNASGLTQVSSDNDGDQVDRSGNVARRNLSVTNKGLGSSNSSNNDRQRGQDGNRQGDYNREPGQQPAQNSYGRGQMRMDDQRDLHRIPPKERDFMTYDHIGHFYKPEFHYFGYRVKELPPSYRQMKHWGRRYYYYDDVYYTRYGSYYRVCRPPFGVVLDMALDDLTMASVRFAYYHNVYHDMNLIDSNYRTILQQNRTIAQNNARIARQNAQLALNSSRALSAYEVADALQLIQSYADIDTEYYYEDGVFYTINSRGRYEVIVPPAGALVDQLPDDYDTIVLSGVEYYRVDDTVYRLTLVDGSPYLEVLGQLPASLAELYY